MMNLGVWISLYIYLIGSLTFCLKCNHLLLMLLSLEFMVLGLYFLLYMCLSFFIYEFFFCMIFLTMSVCEAALGLSVLVYLMRVYGNDYFQSFSILW